MSIPQGSKKSFEQFLQAESLRRHKMKELTLDFLLIRLHEKCITEIRPFMENVYRIIIEEGCMIEETLFPLILITPAYPGPLKNPEIFTENLAGRLINKFGEGISLVYGRRPFLLGNLGESNALYFTRIIPGFSGILEKALTLSVGEKVKVKDF